MTDIEGHRRIQKDTEGHKRTQKDSEGYRGIQEDAIAYRRNTLGYRMIRIMEGYKDSQG